jgi:hypothetical protein
MKGNKGVIVEQTGLMIADRQAMAIASSGSSVHCQP